MTSETFIQDGNYSATLKGAQTRLTAAGKLMVVFLWELEDGRQIKSYSVIKSLRCDDNLYSGLGDKCILIRLMLIHLREKVLELHPESCEHS